MLDDVPAATGHNNPPQYRADIVEAHAAKANEFLDAGGAWLDLKEITTDEQSGKLTDFISGIKQVAKTVEEDRKQDKKPHDDAGKSVQAAYVPILDKLKLAISKVTPMQTAWLEKVEAAQKAEAARQRAEAEAAARAAAEMERRAQARNDIAGEAEAEEARKKVAQMKRQAERTANAPARSTSATGAGRAVSMRTTWHAELTNPRVAYMHFAEHPEIKATLIRLAEQQARSQGFDPTKDTIPGVKLNPIKKAV
jgi:hypothetical protein